MRNAGEGKSGEERRCIGRSFDSWDSWYGVSDVLVDGRLILHCIKLGLKVSIHLYACRKMRLSHRYAITLMSTIGSLLKDLKVVREYRAQVHR
jgi:hypothetical protein